MVSCFSLKVRPSPLLIVCVVCLSLLLSTSSMALATSKEQGFIPAKTYAFTVNTTADTHDANWGDGVCADQRGRCSLRAATEEADALPYGSTITIIVPAGTYRLTKGALRLSHHRSLTIEGASSQSTIIQGNHTARLLSIGGPRLVVALSGLTLSGGVTAYSGGAIENYGMLRVSNSIISHNSAASDGGGIMNESGGTVSVSNSTFSGNSATKYGGGIENYGMLSVSQSIVNHDSAVLDGGGIENYGTLSVSNSTFSGNSAFNFGGGIDNDSGGTVTVSNSTLSGNSATDYGGGISNDSGGTVTVSSSTLSGNSASFGGGINNENGSTLSVSTSTFSGNSASFGGGISNSYGTVTVRNSTLSSNSASYSGGGIDNDGGTVTVSSSTFSGNKANSGGGGGIDNYNGGTVTLTGTIVANSKGSSNCYGPIKEGVGYNLDSGSSCGFSLKTDLTNTDPKLGPLRNNGGPTQTMALLQGSKAIDWVNHLKDCPATDQRGYPRPDNSESACDIGAYESSY